MKKSRHGETPGPVLTSQVFCACGSLLGYLKNQAKKKPRQQLFKKDILIWNKKYEDVSSDADIPPMIERMPLDHVGTGAAMPQITHRAQTNLTFNFPLNAWHHSKVLVCYFVAHKTEKL